MRCTRIALRGEIAALFLAMLAVSCAATQDPTEPTDSACADVIAAEIAVKGGGYEVTATVSSPDTGWDKYADAWVLRGLDGEVLATRELAHPHVDEQPFTRSLGGVELPDGTDAVEIAARDSVEGFCGATVVLEVPGAVDQ